MIQIRQIPPGFSADIPDYNLVFNVSPFPIIRPIGISEKPYDVEAHLVWVQFKSNLYGLFDSKVLNFNRCPTCGQAWNPEGDVT